MKHILILQNKCEGVLLDKPYPIIMLRQLCHIYKMHKVP